MHSLAWKSSTLEYLDLFFLTTNLHDNYTIDFREKLSLERRKFRFPTNTNTNVSSIHHLGDANKFRLTNTGDLFSLSPTRRFDNFNPTSYIYIYKSPTFFNLIVYSQGESRNVSFSLFSFLPTQHSLAVIDRSFFIDFFLDASSEREDPERNEIEYEAVTRMQINYFSWRDVYAVEKTKRARARASYERRSL